MIKARNILTGLAVLCLGTASLVSQGQIILNRGQVLLNGGVVIMNNGGTVYDSRMQPAPTQPEGDLLQFQDGSTLHGKFFSFEKDQRLRWTHPDAKQNFILETAGLDFVRLTPNRPIQTKGGCRLRLQNGDDLAASITAIDSESVTIQTSFAGEKQIPRSAIESITMLSSNTAVTYEGPYTLQGWNIAPTNSWWFRDGTLTARGSGLASCNVGLRASSTVELDLLLPDNFLFMVNLYTDKDQVDYSGTCYGLIFTQEDIQLRCSPADFTAGSTTKAQWPSWVNKKKMHLTIQINRARKTIAVFADYRLVKRWEDRSEVRANGGKFLINDMSGRPGMVVSNIRATVWEGAEPEVGRPEQTNCESVALFNRDRAIGKILGLSEGKVGLELGKRQLHIPLERVTQINFPATAAAKHHHPGEVRATLAGFGQICFQLQQWDTNRISGDSALFGPVEFPSEAVRQIDFNLDAPKPEKIMIDEFGGLDE